MSHVSCVKFLLSPQTPTLSSNAGLIALGLISSSTAKINPSTSSSIVLPRRNSSFASRSLVSSFRRLPHPPLRLPPLHLRSSRHSKWSRIMSQRAAPFQPAVAIWTLCSVNRFHPPSPLVWPLPQKPLARAIATLSRAVMPLRSGREPRVSSQSGLSNRLRTGSLCFRTRFALTATTAVRLFLMSTITVASVIRVIMISARNASVMVSFARERATGSSSEPSTMVS